MPSSSRKSRWPRYEIAPRQYIHAIGAVAANFNYLESWLKFLFRIYVDLPAGARQMLFVKQDTMARLNLLSPCFEGSNHEEKFKDALRRFVAGYAACAENRNILMHAQVVPLTSVETGDVIVALFKAPKRGSITDNLYGPTLRDVRRIADEIHAFAIYGREVGCFICSKHQPDLLPSRWKKRSALPRKPAVPDILSPLPREALRIP